MASFFEKLKLIIFIMIMQEALFLPELISSRFNTESVGYTCGVNRWMWWSVVNTTPFQSPLIKLWKRLVIKPLYRNQTYMILQHKEHCPQLVMMAENREQNCVDVISNCGLTFIQNLMSHDVYMLYNMRHFTTTSQNKLHFFHFLHFTILPKKYAQCAQLLIWQCEMLSMV